MKDTDKYEKAKMIVELRLSFFIHLTVYVCINTLLIIINLNTVPEKLWFKWPLMGWGIGLVIHGLITFLNPKISSLKEKMIEREMKRRQ